MTFRSVGKPTKTDDIANRTRCEMADLWRFVEETLNVNDQQVEEGSWGSLIKRAATNYLTVSAMPFQDVWTGETERWKRCCIHEVTPDGKLIPLCLYNVSDMEGKTMYRHPVMSRFAKK